MTESEKHAEIFKIEITYEYIEITIFIATVLNFHHL